MDKELQIMLPMKISNWESIPYSEGLNCPNPECTNKSYDNEARSILGWCETPYGFMQVCECKKCFTKYRMHGFPGDKFSFHSFMMYFMPRIELQGGIASSHQHEENWFDEDILVNGSTFIVETNGRKWSVLCERYDRKTKNLFAVHYLSPDGVFRKGGHLNLDGAKVRKATDKEAVSLFYSFLKHK